MLLWSQFLIFLLLWILSGKQLPYSSKWFLNNFYLYTVFLTNFSWLFLVVQRGERIISGLLLNKRQIERIANVDFNMTSWNAIFLQLTIDVALLLSSRFDKLVYYAVQNLSYKSFIGARRYVHASARGALGFPLCQQFVPLFVMAYKKYVNRIWSSIIWNLNEIRITFWKKNEM